MSQAEFLMPSKVAEILQVSPKTVSRWAKAGRIPHIRTLGGHRRFDPVEIEKLARELRVGKGKP